MSDFYHPIDMSLNMSSQTNSRPHTIISIEGNIAIVGAHNTSYNGIDRVGAAYIYERNDSGEWIEQPILTESPPTRLNYFGSNVYIKDNTAYIAGERGEGVHMFKKVNNTWTQQKSIKA